MKVSFENQNDTTSEYSLSNNNLKINQKCINEIIKAVTFFAKELNISDDSEINILWAYEEDMKNSKLYAKYSHGMNNKYDVVINAWFYKKITSISDIHDIPFNDYDSMLTGLAHEIIHVKQFNKKEFNTIELKHFQNKIICWKEKEFFHTIRERNSFKTSQEFFSYYKSLPWEKEAFDNMDSLSQKYLKNRHLITVKDIFSKIANKFKMNTTDLLTN